MQTECILDMFGFEAVEGRQVIAVRLKRSAAAIRKRATSLGIVLASSTKAPGLNAKGK